MGILRFLNIFSFFASLPCRLDWAYIPLPLSFRSDRFCYLCDTLDVHQYSSPPLRPLLLSLSFTFFHAWFKLFLSHSLSIRLFRFKSVMMCCSQQSFDGRIFAKSDSPIKVIHSPLCSPNNPYELKSRDKVKR